MKKYILIIIVFMFCSSCSAATIDDYRKAKSQHDAVKVQASVLNNRYINLPIDNIVSELGKPVKILRDDFPFFLEQNCRQNGCAVGHTDEVWIYRFNDTTQRGIHTYEIWVYIKSRKIVQIDS